MICAIIGIASAANLGTQWYTYDHTDGQPYCKQAGLTYRNNWDPTKFWVCAQSNSNAIMRSCPHDTPAFQGSIKKCVTWAEYKWETPVNPELSAQ